MSDIQEKLKVAREQADAQKKADDGKFQEPGSAPTKPSEEDVSQLESLVTQFGSVTQHPRPEVIGEISEEEKSQILAEVQAAERAKLPAGLYAYSAGSLFGSNGLVKLIPTPHGNFQSVEDIEATGTHESWKNLLDLGQAFEVESKEAE